MKSWLHFLFVAFAIGLVIFLGAPLLGQAAPPQQGPSNQNLIRRLNQETAGTVRISIHAETGQVRFIGTSPAQLEQFGRTRCAIPVPHRYRLGF